MNANAQRSKVSDSAGARVAGCCKSPDVGAEN